jgi:hypothetical protein
VGLGAIATGLILVMPRIPQDTAYHHFADQRKMLGVPNLLDVASNLPLGVAGILGLLLVRRKTEPDPGEPFTHNWERQAFGLLFTGAALTAAGSIYYHLAPNNATLFWDRLPMTIVFMSFFAITIAERISVRLGRVLLLPLVASGIASVVYWRLTETEAAGDLRFYILVQFFPMLAVPLMLVLFPPRYTRTAGLFAVGGWYMLAKIFEVLDVQVFALARVVSGHTLKHFAAALAIYWLLRTVKGRRLVQADGDP